MSKIELEPDVNYVKIYGLQRSGTNYMAHLLNTNFKNTKVLVNLGGWKHGAYAAEWILGQKVPLLIVVKNPYAWLKSVHDYWGPKREKNIGPDLRNVAFEQFVRGRVTLEQQKGVPYLYRASNPVQYWNNMNFHWTSIQLENTDLKVCVMTYEAMLYSLEAVLLQISDALDLDPVSDDFSFQGCENTFVPAEETIVVSDEKFDRLEYYRQKRFLRSYSPELLDFVNSNLDLELMRGFGYPLEGGPPEC